MKITRRQLRQIIKETVRSMYDSPLTLLINQVLEEEGLPYRAIASRGNPTGAFLAPAQAEGPVEAEFEGKEEAQRVVDAIQGSGLLPGLRSDIRQKPTVNPINEPIFTVHFNFN